MLCCLIFAKESEKLCAKPLGWHYAILYSSQIRVPTFTFSWTLVAGLSSFISHQRTGAGITWCKWRLLTSYYKCCSHCIEQRGGPCTSPSIILPTRSSCKCGVLCKGYPSAISNKASPPSLLIIDMSRGGGGGSPAVSEFKEKRRMGCAFFFFKGSCIKIEMVFFKVRLDVL